MKNNYLIWALVAFVAYKMISKKKDKMDFDISRVPVDASRTPQGSED